MLVLHPCFPKELEEQGYEIIAHASMIKFPSECCVRLVSPSLFPPLLKSLLLRVAVGRDKPSNSNASARLPSERDHSRQSFGIASLPHPRCWK